MPAILLLATLGLVAGCGAGAPSEEPPPGPPAAAAPATTLVLGDVEANMPIRRIRWIQPLADLVAPRLGEYGIRRGRVVVAPDLRQMARHLEDGTVDVYLDSPLPSLAVQRIVGSEVILTRIVNGQRTYWSVFVMRAGLGLGNLGDLRGRVLAFQEEHSTTGFLLPAHALLQRGFRIREVKGPLDSVAEDEVGYFFSGDEENTIDMLRTGRVEVGAISNHDFDALPGPIRGQLDVLARTDAVPRQLVTVRPGLESEMVAALRDVLLDLTDDDRRTIAAATQGGGWTWIFESVSEDSQRQLEGFTDTLDRLLRIDD